MSQIEIEFTYNGINTIIQSDKDKKIKDIYLKFKHKAKAEGKILYYIYNGTKIQNDELTFDEIANSQDKSRNKMNILVNEIEAPEEHQIAESQCIIKSKEIICPECQENIRIKIKDYNISLFECKNHHNMDLLLDEYNQTQNINLRKIICQNCQNYNKGSVHNNIFSRCNNCKLNLCPICSSQHDKNHNIINYDEKNYLCEEHNQYYMAYCENCKQNMCLFCEQNHFNHNIIHFGKLIPNKGKLNSYLETLKEKNIQIKNDIKQIIMKLNNVIENFDIYYNINENLILNYNQKKFNYEILYNINNIDKNNIINDMNIIN